MILCELLGMGITMKSKLRQELNKLTVSSYEVAQDVLCVQFPLVNLFMIGKPGAQSGQWVLVDAGTANSSEAILNIAAERFGEESMPSSIILTHGHFDHIGAIKDILANWNIPVYAHEYEMPYLTGRKEYPPAAPETDSGLVAKLSPMFPKEPIDISGSIKALPADGSIPGLHGWKWLHTPGHTPGHISLLRETDKVLIAGDAVTTVKQESALAVLTKDQELHGPPAYFTTDWDSARKSIEIVRQLNPSLIISSHGIPMEGEEMKAQLKVLAGNFDSVALPQHGRYV